jgi:predicted Zn-dependent protease
MSSYRALFDRITKTAVAKVKQESLNVSGSTKNEKSISTDQGTFTVDMGAKEKEVKGTAQAKLVEEIGWKIAAVANQPDFKWEFKTLESDEPNAFCLPGGKVAIYTGIFK